jgi:putative Holliday junction resolvase
MQKIIALDVGNAWTGVAISDPLGIIARPLTTLASPTLLADLNKLLVEHRCTLVVVGLPITMKGTESAQTALVRQTYEALREQYPQVEFVTWDERLSSVRAQNLKPAKNKQDKLASHAIAAAYILDSYLSYRNNKITTT